MKSSIIDVPRRHDQDDLFGIKVYQDALIKYIKLTDTPITIALQGEWGSGKTSLMNLLRWNLCEVDNAPYFPVWINTWQYSLMKTPQQAIISILEGIVNQIGALNPNAKKNESMKKIGGLFKKMATVGAKVAVGVRWFLRHFQSTHKIQQYAQWPRCHPILFRRLPVYEQCGLYDPAAIRTQGIRRPCCYW